MAKELPRIAKSTEETAFASEESYFALEKISENISTLLGTIQIVALNSFRQDSLMAEEIDETRGIKLSIDGLVVKLDEFIETLKRTALRDSLTGDQTNDNTVVPTPSGPGNDGAENNSTFIAAFGGLGFIGKALSLALGALVGAATAWVKTIKLYSDAFLKLFPSVNNAFRALRMNFLGMVTGALMRFGPIIDAATDMINGFKNLSFIQKIADAFKPITNTFKTAFEAVKSFGRVFKRTSDGISGIAKFFGNISKSIAPLAKIFSKIFVPLGVIITAFETIKGAIDGFLEGGLIGGIEGAITGFFNSLIFGPLDMIKSATAWVLGFFGFDKARDALNSFSFATVFTDIVDAIFKPLEGIQDIIVGIFTLDGGRVSSGLETIWNSVIGVVLSPFDLLYDLVSGLFSFAGIELPDFDIAGWVSDAVSSAVNSVKSFFGFGRDEAEQNLSNAEVELRSLRVADAVGLADDGTVIKASRTVNGVADVAGAEASIAERGGRVLAREDREELVREAEREVELRRAELENIRSNSMFSFSSITETISSSMENVSEFFSEKFDFAREAVTGTVRSVTDFASSAAESVGSWFSDKFSFSDTESALVAAVNTITLPQNAAKDALLSAGSWLAGKLGFDETASDLESARDVSIGSIVMSGFNVAKEWLTGIFSWSDTSGEDDRSFLSTILEETITKIETFFTDLFDFIPSFDEIKASLTSMLPDWMRPESISEQRQNLMDQIAEQRRYMSEGDNRNWRGKSRETIISELEAELASLPQANEGGIINAPESGGMAILHGAEIVAPLESPQGKLLNIINESFKQSVAPSTTTYSTVDKSGSMANVMSNTQRIIEDMRMSSTTSTAPVVNNYNVVNGGTNISAPSTSLAIVNPGRRGPASRPDRR